MFDADLVLVSVHPRGTQTSPRAWGIERQIFVPYRFFYMRQEPDGLSLANLSASWKIPIFPKQHISKKLSGLESHKGKSKEEEEEGEGEKKTWTKLEKFSSFPEMKGGE